MPEKSCIFVDGENLRYSILELFSDIFRKDEYLPKRANWAQFYDSLAQKVRSDLQRLRTYWYTIEQLDFTPYLPLPMGDQTKLRQILSRFQKYKRQLDGLSGPALAKRMNEMANECSRRADMMKKRFEGWRRVQDGISQAHHAVEFRRAGAITYNLVTERLGREKAVDVKLATDLYILRSIYDVAIIVSGDQDYVPAVQAIKDHGKIVINVAFEARNGRLLPGGARRLNQVTDSALTVKYADLKPQLGL